MIVRLEKIKRMSPTYEKLLFLCIFKWLPKIKRDGVYLEMEMKELKGYYNVGGQKSNFNKTENVIIDKPDEVESLAKVWNG